MKRRILPLLGIVFLWVNSTMGQNNEWSSARPDGHAPISIMAEHYHKKGGVMVSYRYMSMLMNDNIESSRNSSNEEIHQSFMVVPERMSMSMHMLGVMYAPSDNITLALMGNYISNSMNLRTRMGMPFTTESSGVGDIMLSGLVKLFNNNRRSLHGNIGISIPTGGTDQRDATPMMDNARLAYAMQLGSGTWDPTLGFTYLSQSDRFSWGAQSKYEFRVGENSEDYALGNRGEVIGWGAIRASDHFSFSTSLNFFNTGRIKGADADLNPMMMPLFNTDNSGRSQLDIGLGLNYSIPSGGLKNLRLAVEVKLPAYQRVNGIQMKNTLNTMLGIQYSLGHRHKH